MLLAIDIDKKQRDNAALMGDILTDKNIGSMVTSIGSLATLSNPVTAAVTSLTSMVADSLIKVFKQERDDQAGLLLTSFIRSQHYPYGKRDREDVPDTTGNMFIDYTIFAF